MKNPLLLLLFIILFTACKNDDDTEPDLTKPKASFTFEKGEGYSMTFYNTGEGHNQPAVWNFGDGSGAEGDTVIHTYADGDNYTVTLTLSNDDGNDVASESVQVEEMTYIAEISTSYGDILIYLYKATPLHRANFLELAREGFFNGTIFHRVIDNFMIQGGDPDLRVGDAHLNETCPGSTIEAEIVAGIRHRHGAVGAARLGDSVNPEKESHCSQFYIVDNPQGAPHLDGSYTVFGTTVTGTGVVHEIARQPRNSNDRPDEDIPMDVEIVLWSVNELEAEFGFEMPE